MIKPLGSHISGFSNQDSYPDLSLRVHVVSLRTWVKPQHGRARMVCLREDSEDDGRVRLSFVFVCAFF